MIHSHRVVFAASLFPKLSMHPCSTDLDERWPSITTPKMVNTEFGKYSSMTFPWFFHDCIRSRFFQVSFFTVNNWNATRITFSQLGWEGGGIYYLFFSSVMGVGENCCCVTISRWIIFYVTASVSLTVAKLSTNEVQTRVHTANGCWNLSTYSMKS